MCCASVNEPHFIANPNVFSNARGLLVVGKRLDTSNHTHAQSKPQFEPQLDKNIATRPNILVRSFRQYSSNSASRVALGARHALGVSGE
jgi:hypothetical protein